MISRYLKDEHLYAAGDSIVGQVRQANEDNCGYLRTPNGDLFVVCDGMGGHVGGATASRIAVDSIVSYVNDNPMDDKRTLLQQALLFANMQILGAATADSSLHGMGTTACIVLIDGADAWLAHVGDSRIYLFSEHDRFLYRISKDHSLVQGLVDSGELDDREAESHPQKNIILRALGIKEDLLPEVDQMPVQPAVGDTFLICSDGLSGMIDDNEMENILLMPNLTIEDRVQKLIEAANAPGKGKDNITCQLIRVEQSSIPVSVHPDFTPKWRRPSTAAPATPIAPVGNGRPLSPWLITTLAIVAGILLLLVAGAYLYMRPGNRLLKQHQLQLKANEVYDFSLLVSDTTAKICWTSSSSTLNISPEGRTQAPSLDSTIIVFVKATAESSLPLKSYCDSVCVTILPAPKPISFDTALITTSGDLSLDLRKRLLNSGGRAISWSVSPAKNASIDSTGVLKLSPNTTSRDLTIVVTAKVENGEVATIQVLVTPTTQSTTEAAAKRVKAENEKKKKEPNTPTTKPEVEKAVAPEKPAQEENASAVEALPVEKNDSTKAP